MRVYGCICVCMCVFPSVGVCVCMGVCVLTMGVLRGFAPVCIRRYEDKWCSGDGGPGMEVTHVCVLY